MKTFSHCPKCKNPMQNESFAGPRYERWRISCEKHLDHDILCLTSDGHDDLLSLLCIAFRITSNKEGKLYANWDFDKEELKITRCYRVSDINEIYVPYFEPNLIRYDKLIKKMRTLLTFS